MNVLVFAGLAEAIGASVVTINIDKPVKVAELKRLLGEKYPSAAPQLHVCFAAINQTYANDEALVQLEDEVALIPPVSGG